MSLSEIKDAAQLAVALIAIVAAVGGPLWMQRVVRELSALRQIANAQLAEDSGTSLIDKVNVVHDSKLPAIEAAVTKMAGDVNTIAQRQIERMTDLQQLKDGQGRIETKVERLEHRQERIELRQEIGARLVAVMVPGLASSVQAEVAEFVQDPKVQAVIAEMLQEQRRIAETDK